MKREQAPQYIQYLDGLINIEVLKRATFPIKVSPVDNTTMEVHPKHLISLQNLYKEVSDEIITQYTLKETNGVQLSNIQTMG